MINDIIQEIIIDELFTKQTNKKWKSFKLESNFKPNKIGNLN